LGSRFVFGSDELYILSGTPLPDSAFYEACPQIENGVGLVRAFLDDLAEAAQSFPSRIQETVPSFWILGKSAAPILEAEALPFFHQIRNLDLRIKSIPNRFFGESVTVTGLLTGQDIIHALKDESGPYRVLIPPVCLNTEGLFLDDLKVDDISSALDRPVHVLSDFEDFYE
jgi:NifB/MoaA-like Fe-S oxidoreductase